MQVAREGEEAEPREPAPAALRPVIGFNRLSAAAYATIRRAVDDDAGFRARVAAVADEATVGRAGWLWLHRPEGWDREAALASAPAPTAGDGRLTRLRRERDGAEAAAARHRRRADDADAARRRAEAELEAMRRAVDERDLALRRREGEQDRLAEERNAAVRAQKALEAELAAARRDLRVARAATRQAEADLLARPVPTSEPPGPSVGPAPIGPGPGRDGPSPASAADARAARAAVGTAVDAAAELTRALADATAALAPGADDGGAAPGEDGRPTGGGAGSARSSAPGRRRPRRRVGPRGRSALPPGMVAGSPEADRHLVRSPDVLVVVDGYNLARTAWSGLAPEEERRRTIALLEEVAARSGARHEVVFDGDDHAVAPPASRTVGVRFSASGVTADDAIADLLAALPADRAVVVVSSDRAVADDARRQGADVLASAAFLAAVGR